MAKIFTGSSNVCYCADAVTQIFFVIPLKLHPYFLIISANFDAKLDSVPDPVNHDKSLDCFFVILDIVVYVSGVIGICLQEWTS